MTFWQILKIGITRGYILIGICGICFVLLVLMTIVYGAPSNITTDPQYPLHDGSGTRYMPQEQYDRFYFWWGLFIRIGFISFLAGVPLHIRAHGWPGRPR